VFNAEDRDQACERVGHVLERPATVAPNAREPLEAAEEDLIAFYNFSPEHWIKLRSTNPLKRVNKEIGQRTDVLRIFPNDATVIRLAGALLSEQNDEWLVQRRYLSGRVDRADPRRARARPSSPGGRGCPGRDASVYRWYVRRSRWGSRSCVVPSAP
jgi:transposase-like protein